MTTGVMPERFDGRVIVDQRHDGSFSEAMFEPGYWQDAGAVIGRAGGRGKVLFVEAGSEQWVLRHYHRGGMMTPLLRDRYIWKGAEMTRSLREWRLLADLYDRELPVPAPVAARYVRDGGFYRADLLTVRIPGTQSLADIVGQRTPGEEEWQRVGRCIRRFHDQAIYHADLNAHNILINQGGEVFLVDFDRGRIRKGQRWKGRTLRRLNRSLHKIGLSLSTPDFEKRQWPALLAGYQDPR